MRLQPTCQRGGGGGGGAVLSSEGSTRGRVLQGHSCDCWQDPVPHGLLASDHPRVLAMRTSPGAAHNMAAGFSQSE